MIGVEDDIAKTREDVIISITKLYKKPDKDVRNMNHAETYKYASGVDINTAYAKYSNERASGYAGEYKVFQSLLSMQEEQHYKILLNVEIPAVNGRMTEIDLLMITSVGFLVFEMKNYKGTIYGTPEQEKWTQYFRTVSNHRFQNPIHQNSYHVKALQKMYPDVPIYSIIVFTNPDCDIRRVAYRTDRTCVICADEVAIETKRLLSQPLVFDEQAIEAAFECIKKFSKLSEPTNVYVGDDIATINDLITETRAACSHIKEKTDKECKAALESAKEKYKKKTKMMILACALVAAAGIYFGIYTGAKADMERELAIAAREAMAEYFLPVDESDLSFCEEFIMVSDFAFSPHAAYEDTASLVFSIQTNSGGVACIDYAGSQLIVKLRNGEALYYDVCECSEKLTFMRYRTMDGKVQLGAFTVPCELEDIEFIKITNAAVYPDYINKREKNGRIVDIAIY